MGREMLANETPVCVTIRDCCTAGFDVHLQASTIHPSLSLSLSYPPPSSRVLFLAEPFPSSSLLSYPIRSTGIEEGKGEGEKVWIGLCVRGDAKVQKRRSRKSTERGERSETCRRIGAERRRVAADYRVRLSFNELANCSNCCSVPRCISPRVLPLERSVGWRGRGEVGTRFLRYPLVTFMIRVKQRFSSVSPSFSTLSRVVVVTEPPL